jgi:hypothetical protein
MHPSFRFSPSKTPKFKETCPNQSAISELTRAVDFTIWWQIAPWNVHAVPNAMARNHHFKGSNKQRNQRSSRIILHVICSMNTICKINLKVKEELASKNI